MAVTEEFKQRYHEKYAKAKSKGGKFFPDVIYKDTLMMLAIFIVLVMLATFVGVANEPKADPSDSTYIPRPEWYFLFLFEMLKFFPGAIEWVGTVIIPGLAVGALFLLPFIDRNPYRHFSKRRFGIAFMSLIVLGMIALTIRAVITTPVQAETGTLANTLSEQIVAGQDLYSVQCVECHGAEGEGGEIKGVEGLEGVIVKPINSQDEMYTRNDETLFDIISYGQPNLGMTPFGKAFGGELGVSDIEAIVAFMRYTWDDRAELPEEAARAGAIPELKEGEIPSYEVHVAPIVKRYCVSCHRPGKEADSQNYLMTTYDELMNSGDHTPNVTPFDLTSHLFRMINREEIEDVGGAMPPTKALDPKYIEVFRRWIEAGAPNTAADAAAAGGAPAATQAPAATAAPDAATGTATP